MSKTIDEKVVSIQFDNQQFEKNVSTTMSTLDKLKQKLKFCHLKDSLRSYKIYYTPAENGYEHARFPFFV